MIEKTGRLADIVFRNEENFYTVAVVEDDEAMEQFTVTGNIPSLSVGMEYRFRGDWKTHPSYGEQFAVTDCVEIIPKTTAGIKEFLASGAIRGVGPKTAALITGHFGEKTLDIIADNPEKLTEISGIGSSKAEMIAASYRAHREFADIALFFSEYGVAASYAMRMYKIYGGDTVRVVKENPYRLITDIRGIGFTHADRIAEKLGVARDSEFRMTSGLKYMLQRWASGGHTCVPYSRFIEESAAMLELPMADLKDAADRMAVEGIIRIEELMGSRMVYPFIYYEAESNVARRLYSLQQADVKPVRSEINSLIDRVQSETGISLSENQRTAVRNCAENGVCVITGGPGTGKTTIINTIIRIFEASGQTVAIAAPTGRAAKRITETSGRPAVTIHRLLEYYYSEDEDAMNFGKNASDPLEKDVVIIDEMSMVDILLMDALTEAIVPGTRLVMVGDADQLPSVGAGNVLRDIIASEMIHTVRLTEIFRQAEESMIVVNAHRINGGEYPYCNEKDRDFFFMTRSSEAAVVNTIIELCSSRLPKFYTDCDPLRDIQVLTPTRKGNVGTASLNRRLQEVLNPPSPSKPERELPSGIFRKGDKVMQIKNNYQLEWKRTDTFEDGQGVYNGDIGFISSIDKENSRLSVIFDDVRRAEYEFSQTDELELAYAMTIHKSQGSEFPVIVMPMANFPPVLANRNLLYTGVTRGKKSVVLVGSRRSMEAMVDNNRTDERYSGLRERLKHFLILEEL